MAWGAGGARRLGRSAAGVEARQPLPEEAALDLARRECDRLPVGGVGLAASVEAAEQVGARRVQEVVVVEPDDAVDGGEAALRPLGERERDRRVERDDGRRR